MNQSFPYLCDSKRQLSNKLGGGAACSYRGCRTAMKFAKFNEKLRFSIVHPCVRPQCLMLPTSMTFLSDFVPVINKIKGQTSNCHVTFQPLLTVSTIGNFFVQFIQKVVTLIQELGIKMVVKKYYFGDGSEITKNLFLLLTRQTYFENCLYI